MASLMNGLSSAGQGLASFATTTGLEAQKADAAQALQASGGVIQGNLQTQRAQLEQQQAILADQLATARESGGRVQAGGIAATAAALEQAAAQKRTETTINADTPEIKLLRALGVPLAGDAARSPAQSNATPSPSGAPQPGGGVGMPANQMDNPLVVKALGLPQTGSEAANRLAIAQDVRGDPAWKYKTAGQQAAEIENRYQIATAKIADPETRDTLAAAIANYQLSPLDERARQMPGGPETMKTVLKLNPDYQEGRYPEINKTMVAFGPGPEGDKTRFLNVGVQHLDVFDQAAQALKNGDIKGLNSLSNYFQDQFGVAAPNTLDGLKQIVATEIEKAVAGGIGASGDRDRLMKSLSGANSPQALQEMTDGFRALMNGQLKGLQRQYEDATPNTPSFRGAGQFSFQNKLDPATIKALSGSSSRPMSPVAQPQQGSNAGVGDAGLPAPASDQAPTHPPLPPGFRIIQ